MLTAREKAAPCGVPSSTNDPGFHSKQPPKHSVGRFSMNFCHPKATSENQWFFESPKTSQRSAFWTKNDNFWHPFLHCFSPFFENRKSAKYAKSIMRNVVSSHQKPLIFASFFHRSFIFFPKPLPESIFRGSKSELSLKSLILERSAISRGPKMAPYSQIIFLKITKRRQPGMRKATLEATWARYGAENAPKSYFHRSGVVFVRFLNDFGQLLMDFWHYSIAYAHSAGPWF